MHSGRGATNAGRRIWGRRDGILILSLLLISLIFVIKLKSRTIGGGRICQIIYDREVVMTVSLDENRIFSIEQLPQVVFEVRDGHIAFIRSDCPDQVCVHTGFIGEPEQFAACLPNRAAIRIVVGGGDNAPDTVA